jgi:hypothetical protein
LLVDLFKHRFADHKSENLVGLGCRFDIGKTVGVEELADKIRVGEDRLKILVVPVIGKEAIDPAVLYGGQCSVD